jgi:hypothetical protein
MGEGRHRHKSGNQSTEKERKGKKDKRSESVDDAAVGKQLEREEKTKGNIPKQ